MIFVAGHFFKFSKISKISWGLAMFAAISSSFTGCWDSREIDRLFIVTAVSMDVAAEEGEMDFSAQVANIPKEEKAKDTGGGGGEQGNSFALSATAKTVDAAVKELDRDSDHKLMFSHNRVRMFGMALAKKGIKEYIDIILRDHQARPEVPIIVVDGRADGIINAKLDGGEISGLFISGMLEDLAQSSKYYRVKLIDFVNSTLDKSTAPVIPLIEMKEKNGSQEIGIKGMAVFKDGIMIGSLDNDATSGYLYAMGGLQKSYLKIFEGEKRAVLNIMKLSCKRKVTLNDDNSVKVSLSVNADLSIGEIMGFEDEEPNAFVQMLEKKANEEIEKKIRATYKTAEDMEADIFGIGVSIYKKTPKKWEKIKDRWDEIFKETELEIKVKSIILGTGQTVKSFEMEASSGETR